MMMDPQAFLWMCSVMALVLFATPQGLCSGGIALFVTFSPYTYALTALTCAFAVAYGLWSDTVLVYAINAIGVAAEGTYVVLFLINCEAADSRRWWLIRILIGELVLLLFGIVLLFVNIELYMVLRSVTGIAVAAAPLVSVPSVFRTGNVASLTPTTLAVVSLFNAAAWTVNFKRFQPDNYQGGPNWAAMGCTVFQLTLRAFFWWRPPRQQQLPIAGTVHERLLVAASNNNAPPPPPPPPPRAPRVMDDGQVEADAHHAPVPHQEVPALVNAPVPKGQLPPPPPPPPRAPEIKDGQQEAGVHHVPVPHQEEVSALGNAPVPKGQLLRMPPPAASQVSDKPEPEGPLAGKPQQPESAQGNVNGAGVVADGQEHP